MGDHLSKKMVKGINTIKIVIQYVFLQPVSKEWNQLHVIYAMGLLKAPNVCRAKDMHNRMTHSTAESLTSYDDYNQLLNEIEDAVVKLEYQNICAIVFSTKTNWIKI